MEKKGCCCRKNTRSLHDGRVEREICEVCGTIVGTNCEVAGKS
jgi:hypothetical protein